MALNINSFAIVPNYDSSIDSFDDKWNISIAPGSRSCFFNFLKYLPQNFLITTKNSSEKFNALTLENVSTTIKNLLIVNPDSKEYHLDIEDSNNILCKIKQMYQGEEVTISEDIKSNFNEIMKAMGFDQSPNFDFLKIDTYERFIIETKKRKYRCNIYGVLLSTVIRNIISKSEEEEDEEERYYFYNFEDANEEFQILMNIFNFQDVKLTEENYDVLKKFAQDLEIEIILDILYKYENKEEYRETIIDEQETVIEKIDELFKLLFNLKNSTIDFTFSDIIGSEFSKSEEYVNELVSFIIVVAQTKIELQDSLIDLMIKINKEGPDEMKNLVYFVVSRSMFLFTKKMDSTEINLIYPFVYRMYKRNLIPKDQIIYKINESKNKIHNNFFISWFLPEIFEVSSYNIENDRIEGIIDIQIGDDDNLRIYKNELFFTKDINRMSEYNDMRDKNENDDVIAKVIKNDDVNQLQKIVSINPDIILNGTIRSNIFEPFINNRISYLNYAAFNGSINCFKYLLLNKKEIDKFTYELSIIGSNFEIIRIVDNAKNHDCLSKDFVLNELKLAIKYHHDELFDWIFDSYYHKIKDFKDFESLINCSIENFNYHSLIQIFGNNDLNFLESSLKFSSFLEKAAEKGSYNYLILLMNLFDIRNTANILISLFNTICSDNIFIFNLFHKSMKEEDLIEVIFLSLKNDCYHIINYILDNYEIKFDKNASQKILICFESIFLSKEINDVFDRIIKLCSYDFDLLIDVILGTIDHDNNEYYKKIIGLVNNNEKSETFYRQILIIFIFKNKYEMTKYIIDQKYPVNFYFLVNEIQKCGDMNIKLFRLLMDTLSPELQMELVDLLDDAISSKNYPLVEFIYSEYVLKSNDFMSEIALIGAIRLNNNELLIKILEKRSDPPFINAITNKGTALFYSVLESNKFAIGKLLSIPGIDLNIIYNNESVLTCAIKNRSHLVRYLLKNETIDVNLVVSQENISPLSMAIYDINCFIYLINHPAIEINYIDSTYYSVFQAPSYQIKKYLFIKNERINYCKNMIEISSLYYFSKLNITKFMIVDNVYYRQEYNDNFDMTFDLTFPNFSSRNFALPIKSHELITGNFCEKYILDFNSNLLTVEITKNYNYIENSAIFKIKILNQNDQLSKKIDIKNEYLNKGQQISTKIPLKLEDILNPENGWLFDDKLKIEVEVISLIKRKSFNNELMTPIIPQILAENIFGFRFLIPIYLFAQNKSENLIIFPNIMISMHFSISPIIFYYFEEDKINIHTYFIYGGKGRFSFKDLILYYQNNDIDKNFVSMFSDDELCAYVKMPVLTLEKTMKNDGFTFIYKREEVLKLCFTIRMRE